MHPPLFRIQQLLSDWPDCWLELSCSSCGRKAIYPVGMMHKQFGDRSFEQLMPRLKCKGCGASPAPVYLGARHPRGHGGGPPPDWAVLLVPPPKP